jgi:hypothetical protein
LKTLVIGRSPFADVIIADASVASHHAEIVVTDDGRLYLTDCATETGTLRANRAAADAWQPVRQCFVDEDVRLRLGEYQVTVAELLKVARAPEGEAGGGGGRDGGDAPRRGLRGRVERDPATGEIIRRRR